MPGCQNKIRCRDYTYITLLIPSAAVGTCFYIPFCLYKLSDETDIISKPVGRQEASGTNIQTDKTCNLRLNPMAFRFVYTRDNLRSLEDGTFPWYHLGIWISHQAEARSVTSRLSLLSFERTGRSRQEGYSSYTSSRCQKKQPNVRKC